jgi:hypothetical protein
MLRERDQILVGQASWPVFFVYQRQARRPVVLSPAIPVVEGAAVALEAGAGVCVHKQRSGWSFVEECVSTYISHYL